MLVLIRQKDGRKKISKAKTMLRRASTRLIVASLVGILFLLANVTPRVQCQCPATNDGDIASYSNGDLHYGWPKLIEIDTITQTSNHETYLKRQFSISHLLGLQEFKVAIISRSVSAIVSNAALGISTVLLLIVAIQSFASRKISIRLLFAAIMLVGVITASLVSVCPLQ